MYQTNTANGRQLALSGYGPDVSSKKRKLSEFSAGTSTPPPAGHPLASGSRPYYPSYPSSSSHLASAPNSGVGTNPRSNDMSRTRAPRPVFPSSDPVPPFYGISSTHGTYSTYASRLKLGTTSLIQPILAGSAPPATPSTQNNAGSVGLSGRRSRNVVNYAELDGMNEDGDGEDEGDEEFTTSSRTRGTPASNRRAIPPPPVPPVEKPPIPAPALPTRTYLGEPPPGNLVMVKPAIRTRHLHRCVLVLAFLLSHLQAPNVQSSLVRDVCVAQRSLTSRNSKKPPKSEQFWFQSVLSWTRTRYESGTLLSGM